MEAKVTGEAGTGDGMPEAGNVFTLWPSDGRMSPPRPVAYQPPRRPCTEAHPRSAYPHIAGPVCAPRTTPLPAERTQTRLRSFWY